MPPMEQGLGKGGRQSLLGQLQARYTPSHLYLCCEPLTLRAFWIMEGIGISVLPIHLPEGHSDAQGGERLSKHIQPSQPLSIQLSLSHLWVSTHISLFLRPSSWHS